MVNDGVGSNELLGRLEALAARVEQKEELKMDARSLKGLESPSGERASQLKRRGLLAGVAGLTAALAGRLTGGERAEAGHETAAPYDPTKVLHLGVRNDGGAATDDPSSPDTNITSRTALVANVAGYAVRVENTSDSALQALALAPESTAINGVGGKVGVRGDSSEGAGIFGFGNTPKAIGVVARTPGGIGLRVAGRAGFTTCGNSSVAAGQDSRAVALEDVRPDSFVGVTLMGDPGIPPGPPGPGGVGTRATVAWVERQPGVGFVLRLTRAVSNPTPFAYFVVEPGPSNA